MGDHSQVVTCIRRCESLSPCFHLMRVDIIPATVCYECTSQTHDKSQGIHLYVSLCYNTEQCFSTGVPQEFLKHEYLTI